MSGRDRVACSAASPGRCTAGLHTRRALRTQAPGQPHACHAPGSDTPLPGVQWQCCPTCQALTALPTFSHREPVSLTQSCVSALISYAMIVHNCLDRHLICRNPGKSHLRHAIPSADRGPALLESPSIFNFTADRLMNGVRSPQTRQTGQPRARGQNPPASAKRDAGIPRVEPGVLESSPALGRGR